MSTRIRPVIDSFVPTWMHAAGPEMVRRGRTAVLIAWLMGTMFGAVLVMRLAAAEWASALVDVGLVVACFSGPYLLRWTGWYHAIANGVLGAVWGLLVYLGWANPNPGLNAATMALAEIPLFAILLFGPRLGYAWSVACAFAVLVIGVLDFAEPLAPTPAERAAFNEYWAAVVMSLTLVSAGLFYEQGKNDSLQRIQQLEAGRREADLASVRAEADAKVQQAERFASLGRLAAAVAHEINNPLSYVQGNIRYAVRPTGGLDPEVRQALVEALEGVDRIRRIVDDLRGFTRPVEDDDPIADIARAISSAVAMADAHTRSKADVVVDIAPALFAAGDEPRLSQAILNLVINSAQALPDGQKHLHTIAVRARRVGDRAVVEVLDDGPGIPPAIVDRVREPFFTTKPVGEGTGLGLALADGIARSYGGGLAIESRPGYTSVRIALPIREGLRELPEPFIGETDLNLSLRIVICDDEPMVARAIARHLPFHDVHVVPGGQALLDRMAVDADVDLVICDLMMPYVSGMDVHDRVRERWPHLQGRFVFMSGGAFTERAQALRESDGVRFLEKPIVIDELRAVVRDASHRVRKAKHRQPPVIAP